MIMLIGPKEERGKEKGGKFIEIYCFDPRTAITAPRPANSYFTWLS